MHLGTAALLDFHAHHREDDALVLAVITKTSGSTYRKPGAMMLIAPDDSYAGLISGGCLEGDLLEHASEVFSSGRPKQVIYDMHSDEDLVWGMGIGCDGLIELLLLRLDRDHHQSLLDGVRAALGQRRKVAFGLVTRAQEDQWSLGTLAFIDEKGLCKGDRRLAGQMAERLESGWPEGRFSHEDANGAVVMLINLTPRPRLLLCGGGPDARPVAAQAEALGWECFVMDHRSAYADARKFPEDTTVVLGRPATLSENIELSAVDAAVIMSHHLESDSIYLRQLAPFVEAGSLAYLGVLGPVARRNRLREMAECPDVLVHGPVGLDIGAELPEAIALAVLAEIHAVLNQRDGQSLTTGPVGDAN